MYEESYCSDSSDDDENIGKKKALAVDIPDNFDPNIIPQNGEEYLHLVMYEARRCKQIVIANLDESKLKAPTVIINLNDECIKAPKSMLAPLEWQQEKVSDFSKLRKFVQSKSTTQGMEDTIHESYWLPQIIDTQPNFSLIIKFSQNAKIKLLGTIIDHLDTIEGGKTIEYNVGIWLYSILATLEIPLCPNSCHCLRELARKCSIIRSKLPENSTENAYIHLNLMICLVARYFNQFDLAD